MATARGAGFGNSYRHHAPVANLEKREPQALFSVSSATTIVLPRRPPGCGRAHPGPIDKDRVARELDRLDPFEADLVELTRAGRRQSDLVIAFGVVQSVICYRLHCALKWLCGLREISEDE